jgi:phosphatidylglycerol:prolipoprotein diacylglycerol transferase
MSIVSRLTLQSLIAITVLMLPIITIGSLEIQTYGVVVSLSLILVGMYSFHRLRRLDVPVERIINGGLATILGGIALAYLVFYMPRWVNHFYPGLLPEDDSKRITWVLVGCSLVATLYCRKHGIRIGQVFDLGVLPCPLGQGVARLGCLAAGCCYGKPTDSILGMYLPDVHGHWELRYPTQLLDAVANFLIFIILVVVERYGRRRKKPGQETLWPFDGFIFLLFVELFFLKRSLMSFMRQDAVAVIGPFSWMFIQAIIGILIASVLMIWNFSQSRRSIKFPGINYR